jgi:hypothetical protein
LSSVQGWSLKSKPNAKKENERRKLNKPLLKHGNQSNGGGIGTKRTRAQGKGLEATTQ